MAELITQDPTGEVTQQPYIDTALLYTANGQEQPRLRAYEYMPGVRVPLSVLAPGAEVDDGGSYPPATSMYIETERRDPDGTVQRGICMITTQTAPDGSVLYQLVDRAHSHDRGNITAIDLSPQEVENVSLCAGNGEGLGALRIDTSDPRRERTEALLKIIADSGDITAITTVDRTQQAIPGAHVSNVRTRFVAGIKYGGFTDTVDPAAEAARAAERQHGVAASTPVRSHPGAAVAANAPMSAGNVVASVEHKTHGAGPERQLSPAMLVEQAIAQATDMAVVTKMLTAGESCTVEVGTGVQITLEPSSAGNEYAYYYANPEDPASQARRYISKALYAARSGFPEGPSTQTPGAPTAYYDKMLFIPLDNGKMLVTYGTYATDRPRDGFRDVETTVCVEVPSGLGERLEAQVRQEFKDTQGGGSTGLDFFLRATQGLIDPNRAKQPRVATRAGICIGQIAPDFLDTGQMDQAAILAAMRDPKVPTPPPDTYIGR